MITTSELLQLMSLLISVARLFYLIGKDNHGRKNNRPGLICTPFTGHPVKGVFLCVTVTNSNERQSNYTGKGNGLNHQQTSQT